MSFSLNKVELIGNVGADPEIRRSQAGKPIANLRIATEESWRDKNTGERIAKTEWHRVVCFNEHLTKIIEQYVKKGSRIYIVGQLQTRKWTDPQGQERYSTEVVMQNFKGELGLLSSPPGAGGARDPADGSFDNEPDERDQQGGRTPAAGAGGAKRTTVGEDMSDEIPFAFPQWHQGLTP